jgi:two-component system, chemotaxis family, chemotaxis protein CheY
MTINLEALGILVVDDNKHMHSVVKAILNSMRVKNIRFSDNAADAFMEMRQWYPDIIITDWAMQPLDGLDFVRLVRKGADSPNPYIPIILLTGHTEMCRVIEARDTGVNEILAKPISIKSLYSRIASIVQFPRPFVKSKSYFGPCRRRSIDPNFKGPDRRQAPMEI